jgi:hypothetical protein
MRSLVTPGTSSTIERRSPISLLKSVLLPTLGRPTIAIIGFGISKSFLCGALPLHPAKTFFKEKGFGIQKPSNKKEFRIFE